MLNGSDPDICMMRALMSMELVLVRAQSEQESYLSQARLASSVHHCFVIDNHGWACEMGGEA